MEGDRREVSLSLKRPVIMSQASLVKQISENVPSVPEFVPEFRKRPRCPSKSGAFLKCFLTL
jgi:hypothetical protein